MPGGETAGPDDAVGLERTERIGERVDVGHVRAIGAGLRHQRRMLTEVASDQQSRAAGLHRLLENKYYFDRFNEVFFAGGARALGRGLSEGGDRGLIDGLVVNGSARLVGWLAGVVRHVQTGYLYHYAIAMILGVAFLLGWFLLLLRR